MSDMREVVWTSEPEDDYEEDPYYDENLSCGCCSCCGCMCYWGEDDEAEEIDDDE